ncbi:MAG: hypothetical protein PHX51_08050 [Clostridia bacterium]|nr:hypothetical protein [Clostridia bacterium]
MNLFGKLAALVCASKAKKQPSNDSISITRRKDVVIHGVTVKKAVIGRYLDITKRVPGVVMELLDAAFPGQKPAEALDSLLNASKDGAEFRSLITRVLAILPEKAIDIASELMGADATFIKENLMPAEFAEVFKAFWELNDYTDFFLNVRKAAAAMRTKTNISFKDGSHAQSQSESQSKS